MSLDVGQGGTSRGRLSEDGGRITRGAPRTVARNEQLDVVLVIARNEGDRIAQTVRRCARRSVMRA